MNVFSSIRFDQTGEYYAVGQLAPIYYGEIIFESRLFNNYRIKMLCDDFSAETLKNNTVSIDFSPQ